MHRRPLTTLALIVLAISAIYPIYAWILYPGSAYTVVLYGWEQFFELSVFLLPFILGLDLLVLIVLWLVATVRRTAGRRTDIGVAVLLTVAAIILIGIGSVRLGFTQLDHRLSVRAGSHVYNVALRRAMDGDHYYILYECDSLGLRCESRFNSGYVMIYKPEPPLNFVVDVSSAEVTFEIDGTPAANLRYNQEQ